VASEHTSVSLLLQILAVYVAASVTAGLLFAMALGKLIRRGDRRREQEVALLVRSRAVQRVVSRRTSTPLVESAPRRGAG
jgi:hypothetical protein